MQGTTLHLLSIEMVKIVRMPPTLTRAWCHYNSVIITKKLKVEYLKEADCVQVAI